MKVKKRWLTALLCTLPLAAYAVSPEVLKPYPAAAEGMKRHIIELPVQDNEANFKVELIAGKTLEVDCNRQRLSGHWQEQSVKGWGYSYYELQQAGQAASTLMACPDADGKREQSFVPIGGEAMLVRYNSKLPLVIYAPADMEVRYRIWAAARDSSQAPEM